ncbi:MAG TPA: NrfD/PsrC family molybdoenzyme membrane anchor subunit [Natronosporangium sp.]
MTEPAMTDQRPGSYYGQPIIKPPTWKNPDVPAYLFLGGLAGSSATLAALAELTGRPRLARAGQLAAAGAAAGGAGLLIHDLGRPARFLNMLRVLKPTSPLSMGSWLLATFGALAGAAATATVTGLLPRAAWLPKAGAAALGPLVMTYPAVLFADTAVPVWHEAHRELPFLFAGGALTSGAGLGLLAAPASEAGPARLLAVAGTGLELAAERRMTTRLGGLAEPYRQGRPARWMRLGQLLTAAGAAGAVAGRRNRLVAAVAGSALLAGALCTRFGVFEAGLASARDPKYTVDPQRARLAAAQSRYGHGEAATTTP